MEEMKNSVRKNTRRRESSKKITTSSAETLTWRSATTLTVENSSQWGQLGGFQSSSPSTWPSTLLGQVRHDFPVPTWRRWGGLPYSGLRSTDDEFVLFLFIISFILLYTSFSSLSLIVVLIKFKFIAVTSWIIPVVINWQQSYRKYIYVRLRWMFQHWNISILKPLAFCCIQFHVKYS